MNKIRREIFRIAKQILNLREKTQSGLTKLSTKCRTPEYTSQAISKIILEGQEISSFKQLKKQIPANIVLICAFIDRYDILSVAINETLKPKLENPLSIKWVLVGSTEKDFEFIAKKSMETKNVCGFLTNNSPLGGKWQAAVKASRKIYSADLYGIIGSDDIMTNSLLNNIFSQYKKDRLQGRKLNLPVPSLIAPTEWIMVACRNNNLGPNIFRCNYKLNNYQQPLGAGRFYSKDCLTSLNNLIFDGRRENNLDTRGWNLIKAKSLSTTYYNLTHGILASIKGPWVSLNSADAIEKSDTVCVEEYSFKGIRHLKASFSEQTLNFITQ